MNVEDLMNDSEFKARLDNARDLPTAAAIFREAGVEVTDDQLRAAVRISGPDGELDEEALEAVSGGMIVTPFLRWILSSGKNRAQGGGGKGFSGGGAMGGR